MFCYVVGTHTKCIINDFAPAPRIDICIIQCHTVTHGTDLRKSPLLCYPKLYLYFKVLNGMTLTVIYKKHSGMRISVETFAA